MSRPKKMLPVVGQDPTPATPSTRVHTDNPSSVDGTERTVVRVEGMDCASCATTVEKRVAQLPGVHRAVVNFAKGRLDAEHGPGLTVEAIEQAVEEAVEEAGFGVERTEEVDRPPFWRTPRALLTLASALLFALGLVSGLSGAPDVVRIGAYALAILVGGLPIFRAALVGLRGRHLDMSVLMSAATLGAAGISEWAEAASVVVLFAAGNALQIYAIDRTRGAVRALARLTPDEVLVRRDGTELVVPVDQVGVGEIVVVRPGECLAIDGEIVEGETTINEAPVTGEGVPVEKGQGDMVFSGSLNGSGGMLVRVSRKAEDSTLQKITRLVEEAQAKRPPPSSSWTVSRASARPWWWPWRSRWPWFRPC